MQTPFIKTLLILLISTLIGIYYTSRSKPVLSTATSTDDEICASLPQAPSTLPFISYSTQKGFDECVSRCMTNVLMQVCPQLPDKSTIFATQPEVKQQMLDGCIQNIKGFVTHNTRCPYLNCEP
jgi:hypothetical protein